MFKLLITNEFSRCTNFLACFCASPSIAFIKINSETFIFMKSMRIFLHYEEYLIVDLCFYGRPHVFRLCHREK